MKKKIVFLTGTRADFGKLKSLILKAEKSNKFESHIFVTGMHMLSKYGSTYNEVEKQTRSKLHKFINQTSETRMDIIASNTILGFSNYVNELKPDLIVVHGDRIEAFAAAIVGALNNIIVAHIEGGELSGTIDESIRHSISKLAHIHFVANTESKKRLMQMGENKNNIYVIGSPDIDVMLSEKLPDLASVKKYYQINFDKYGIFLFHPVTTELSTLKKRIRDIVQCLINSNKQYVVIYPNNDEGSDIIIKEIEKLRNNKNFRIFPSIRFEKFLTLLKNASFIIGNSSSGIREAEVYGVPCINIGTRQNKRSNNKNIINAKTSKEIIAAIANIENIKLKPLLNFGIGNSSEKFFKILNSDKLFEISIQKMFFDID